MSSSRLTLALAAAVLGLVYCLTIDLVFPRLPYAELPSGWLDVWPTRSVGVLVWFQLLTTIGAFAAALPIALIIVWRTRQAAPRLALGASLLATLWWLSEAIQYSDPHSWLSLGNLAGTSIALLLAIPLQVLLARRLVPEFGTGGT